MKNALIFLFALMFIFAQASYAQPMEATGTLTPARSMSSYNIGLLYNDKPAADMFNSEENLGAPINKAGAGFINAATCWADIPKQISDTTQESNIFMGLTVGFGKGLVVGAARGVSGVYDITTSGLPPYDEPVMQPEYKVEHPQTEGFRVNLMQW